MPTANPSPQPGALVGGGDWSITVGGGAWLNTSGSLAQCNIANNGDREPTPVPDQCLASNSMLDASTEARAATSKFREIWTAQFRVSDSGMAGTVTCSMGYERIATPSRSTVDR